MRNLREETRSWMERLESATKPRRKELLGASMPKKGKKQWLCGRADLPQSDSGLQLKQAIKALEHQPLQVRRDVAYAIGRKHKKRLVPVLLALAQGEPSVRLVVADALGKIGGEMSRQKLIEMTRDDSADVRAMAAETLVELVLDEPERVNRAKLTPIPNSAFTRSTASTLPQQGLTSKEQALGAVRRLLGDDSDHVRTAVRDALEFIDP